jgi:hypothetical protein
MMRAINTRQLGKLAVLMGLGAILVSATPQAVRADDDHGLVGAWTVQVTLRNCDTGAPMGSFSSLVSFHGDGTISEAAASLAFQPGQRSNGHGAWKRVGRRTYSQRMIAMILFSTPANLPGTPTFDPSKPVSPGFSAGSQTVSHRVRLTGPDTIESAGTNEFFDSTGQSYRTGCSTAVGTRFE